MAKRWEDVEADLLAALRRGSHLRAACGLADVSPKAVYRRMRQDQAFRARVEAAAGRTVGSAG